MNYIYVNQNNVLPVLSIVSTCASLVKLIKFINNLATGTVSYQIIKTDNHFHF